MTDTARSTKHLQASGAILHKFPRGFTIVEVLVTAGILAVIVGVIAANLQRVWQNERVLAVSGEFATWLNLVKSYSMRNDAQCTVTVNAAVGGTDFESGGVLPLAAVTPSTCATGIGGGTAALDDEFFIPEMPAGRFNISASSAGNPLSFTPRGVTTNAQALVVEIRSRDAAVAVRCVQVSPILGLIRIGRVAGDSCQV